MSVNHFCWLTADGLSCSNHMLGYTRKIWDSEDQFTWHFTTNPLLKCHINFPVKGVFGNLKLFWLNVQFGRPRLVWNHESLRYLSDAVQLIKFYWSFWVLSKAFNNSVLFFLITLSSVPMGSFWAIDYNLMWSNWILFQLWKEKVELKHNAINFICTNSLKERSNI